MQAIFQYALALLMVEAGKAELIDTTPSDNGPVCTFRAVAGDVFSLTRPPLDETQEAAVKATLRQILS